MKYLVSRSCEYVNSFDTKQCRNAVCRFMWVFIYLYIVVSCGLDLAEAAKEMGISWNPCIPYKKTKKETHCGYLMSEDVSKKHQK